MRSTNLSMSGNLDGEVEAWKTVVQPHVASTHLPTYKIISAAPRPRCTEDDVPSQPVIGHKKLPSTTSSSSSRRANVGAKHTTPVTRENLSKISMACAREEDLDAPYSVSSASPRSRNRAWSRSRTGMRSETSNENSETSSDLPSIAEEEE